MMPLVVDYPPIIVRMPWKGKTYAVSGGTWLEVPSDTTIHELPQYLRFKGWKTTKANEPKVWTVEGSTGNQYTVKLTNEGLYSCSCPGYGFRRKCKHVEKTKETLDKPTKI